MSEHTPGPWGIENDQEVMAEVNTGYRRLIAQCHAGHLPERGANARLIAAAPEMLEALRAALAEMVSMNTDLRIFGKGRPEDGAHPDCPIDIARAIIRKATGQAS